MSRLPLTRARILDAAIAMADRDGFDQVTLRRLAAELGVHVTSLYNHLPTRDAVVLGMVEVLVDEAELPVKARDWEDWIRRMAGAIRSVVTRHPGAFAAFFRQPVKGPIAVEVMEAGLASFESAGLSVRDSYQATRATFLAVLGLAADELARHHAGGRVDEAELSAVPPDQSRRVGKLAAMVNTVDRWRFLIDTLVAGIEVRIGDRRRAKSSRASRATTSRR